jgi:molybdate transport system ATP-binding protein/molybdate transport system permease protein
MPLEVAIEKQVSGFRLAVEFTADGAPLGLLGPSGSGKTMTLRAIAGLEKPDRGRIVLHGHVLFDSEHGVNVPARDRRIGLLFQNYALFPHLTVAENIAFGLRRVPRPERTRRVAEQLAATHLHDLASRYPASLSGGEQQRVALARALAVEPAALLLDEPFSALDTHLRGALERQLRETLETYRGSTLFVSHNLEEAYRVCEELVVLARGSVAARGPKEEIFRQPPTLEVARLTGCKNFSRASRTAYGLIEALDWGCKLRVTQQFAKLPAHVAIRAHHIRVRAQDASPENHNNLFPCWLAAITETPFRVTLDLRIGGPPANPADFHVQAEVFKQEWEAFRNLAQPWQVELAPDRLFLLPD